MILWFFFQCLWYSIVSLFKSNLAILNNQFTLNKLSSFCSFKCLTRYKGRSLHSVNNLTGCERKLTIIFLECLTSNKLSSFSSGHGHTWYKYFFLPFINCYFTRHELGAIFCHNCLSRYKNFWTISTGHYLTWNKPRPICSWEYLPSYKYSFFIFILKTMTGNKLNISRFIDNCLSKHKL
ncbi:unnamed protein product [Meganyctiphanes norvegica]|uniref:Uncharacterized protein n=1 Tax=Meganyctiphanes norvegica TaxID=48144 RepID=A0AAV2S4M9_MEGNR